MSTKALVLFSGGLDSILAVKVLEDQGIRTDAICFVSNFFSSEKAEQIAQENNIKLHVIDIRDDYIAMLKKPVCGYGKNLNPCIDCHAMMVHKAREFALKNNYQVIASGEVLGQRPFSQNKEALSRVRKMSESDILRPLSAKLLEETEVEKQGLVDRSKLLSISGRQREEQFTLLKKFAIKNFPSPGGGCILTDVIFADRVKALLKVWPDFNKNDVELLKHGRVFWLLDASVLLVIGRHHEDNVILEKLAQKDDYVLRLKGVDGPSAILRDKKGIFPEGDKEYSVFVSRSRPDDKINTWLEVSAFFAYFHTKSRGKKIVVEIQSSRF